jgi:hypothetical protein
MLYGHRDVLVDLSYHSRLKVVRGCHPRVKRFIRCKRRRWARCASTGNRRLDVMQHGRHLHVRRRRRRGCQVHQLNCRMVLRRDVERTLHAVLHQLPANSTHRGNLLRIGLRHGSHRACGGWTRCGFASRGRPLRVRTNPFSTWMRLFYFGRLGWLMLFGIVSDIERRRRLVDDTPAEGGVNATPVGSRLGSPPRATAALQHLQHCFRRRRR